MKCVGKCLQGNQVGESEGRKSGYLEAGKLIIRNPVFSPSYKTAPHERFLPLPSHYSLREGLQFSNLLASLVTDEVGCGILVLWSPKVVPIFLFHPSSACYKHTQRRPSTEQLCKPDSDRGASYEEVGVDRSFCWL